MWGGIHALGPGTRPDPLGPVLTRHRPACVCRTRPLPGPSAAGPSAAVPRAPASAAAVTSGWGHGTGMRSRAAGPRSAGKLRFPGSSPSGAGPAPPGQSARGAGRRRRGAWVRVRGRTRTHSSGRAGFTETPGPPPAWDPGPRRRTGGAFLIKGLVTPVSLRSAH